jgi:small subunit ribosomal protein S8
MSLSDPIADMLTRVRNAYAAGREEAEISFSNIAVDIAQVLKREGYIRDYAVQPGVPKGLTVYLKYGIQTGPAIRGIKRISKPGLRNYSKAKAIPKVLGGMGISILTTSAGILTDSEARKRNTGGEILCTIW